MWSCVMWSWLHFVHIPHSFRCLRDAFEMTSPRFVNLFSKVMLNRRATDRRKVIKSLSPSLSKRRGSTKPPILIIEFLQQETQAVG